MAIYETFYDENDPKQASQKLTKRSGCDHVNE